MSKSGSYQNIREGIKRRESKELKKIENKLVETGERLFPHLRLFDPEDKLRLSLNS